jgi:uncharacterized HAD superfamily protein
VRRVAVDLDGVLANTMAAFCQILNKRHSTQFTVDSFDRWNIWEVAHIPRDEVLQTFDEAWFDWKTIPAVEDRIGEKINNLHAFGRVDIVTGRSERTVQNAKAWLKEHEIPYDRFIRSASTNSKAKLSYDVFVDDSAELMSDIASGLNRYGILYTQPWNRNTASMPRIFKVNSWSQVPGILEEISSMKE